MRSLRAAFRLAAFAICTFTFYGVFIVGGLVIPNKVYWRQVIFHLWTMSFVKISRMKIVVRGTPPKPPFFLVSNHLSYTDIAAIRATVTGVFVAKAEVKDWFVVGRMVRDIGTVFIDRSNRRDIPRAGEEILRRIDEGEGVIVFPEGTSTKGEQVLPFNSSFLEFAARASLPVSYVSLTYRTPPDEIPPNLAACWWEDITFMAHLWRLLKVREFTAILTFGDSPVTDADRKALARRLRDLVAESFEPVP